MIKITYLLTLFASGLLVSHISCKTKSESETIIKQDALLSLSSLIASNPKDTSLLLKRAKIYEKNKNYELALKDYKRLSELDSTQVFFILKIADIEVSSLQSFRAIERLEQNFKQSKNQEIGNKLLYLYILTTQKEKSKELLKILLNQSPNNAQTIYLQGLLAEDKELFKEAFTLYKKSLDINPNNVNSWLSIISVAEHINIDPDPFYRSALSLFPEHTNLLHSYAQYLTRDYRLDDAKEVYQHIIDVDPSYWDAYYNRGLLFLEQDSLELGQKSFITLVKKNPLFFKGYYYLGIIHELQGNIDSSTHYYKQSLKFAPLFDDAKLRLQKIENENNKSSNY